MKAYGIIQQVKAPPTKHDDLNSIPGTHTEKKLTTSNCPMTSTYAPRHVCPHQDPRITYYTHIQISTIKNKNNFKVGKAEYYLIKYAQIYHTGEIPMTFSNKTDTRNKKLSVVLHIYTSSNQKAKARDILVPGQSGLHSEIWVPRQKEKGGQRKENKIQEKE